MRERQKERERERERGREGDRERGREGETERERERGRADNPVQLFLSWQAASSVTAHSDLSLDLSPSVSRWSLCSNGVSRPWRQGSGS